MPTRRSLVVAMPAALILAASCAATVPVGDSSIEFTPPGAAPMRVFTHRPAGERKPLPAVVVLHGTNRNADDYRDNWVEIADELGLLVLTPEFTKADYPSGYGYQRLGVTDRNGAPRPKSDWASARVERLYDHVVASGDAERGGYYLFGHSAGGQFVHRMMLLAPEARTRLAIAANAGWYTAPDLSLAYPAGLAGTGATRDGLRAALGRRVVVLLGAQDNDPNDRHLSHSRTAESQGPHRLARGEWFYTQLKSAAATLDKPLAWRRGVVPSVGHSNGQMALRAAQLIKQDLAARRR